MRNEDGNYVLIGVCALPLLIGCSQQAGPSNPLAKPGKTAIVTHRIQQVVPQSHGKDSWPDARLWEFRRITNEAYSRTNVRFHWLDPIRIEDPNLHDGKEVYDSVQALSRAAYEKDHRIVVYMTEGLVSQGKSYIGLGSRPTNWPAYSYGTIISTDSFPGVLPHELGHYFGLEHDFDDTCNMMGYSFTISQDKSCLGTKSFTTDQRQTIARWSNAANRIGSAIGVKPRAASSRMRQSGNRGPVVCRGRR